MKTKHNALNKAIDNEPVCTLPILIPEDKLLPFFNYKVQI
jgi:hypothetical protein